MDKFIVSARKYRPQTFDTVVGQAHITTTLKNAIKQQHLAHAFLFCGPRGVGKTTWRSPWRTPIPRKDDDEAVEIAWIPEAEFKPVEPRKDVPGLSGKSCITSNMANIVQPPPLASCAIA